MTSMGDLVSAPKMWTDDEVETLKKMMDLGASGNQIARVLGRSKNMVLGKIHRMRGLLPAPRPRHDYDALAERVREMFKEGISQAEVARRMGVSTSLIHRLQKRYGIAGNYKQGRNSGSILHALGAMRAREKQIARRANQSPLINTVIARARALGELPYCEAIDLPQEPIYSEPISLLDLCDTHCRWPIERDGATMFCGADKVKGPYCARHARLAYRPFVRRYVSDAERERLKRLAIKNISEGKMWRHTLPRSA